MITPLYAALLALMFIVLSLHVIRGRRHLQIGIHDGNNDEMRRRIRAQANFAEYTPIFLILLAFTEIEGLPAYAVHAFGLLFIAGRIIHAYGLLKGERHQNGVLLGGVRFRIRGMACTFLCIGILAVVSLVQYYFHHR
jgi:uncharacterized membrane protein YecN with MAPEG domain